MANSTEKVEKKEKVQKETKKTVAKGVAKKPTTKKTTEKATKTTKKVTATSEKIRIRLKAYDHVLIDQSAEKNRCKSFRSYSTTNKKRSSYNNSFTT